MNNPRGNMLIVDYIITITSIFTNLLVLIGLVKTTFRLPNYKALLCSLVATDLFICTVNLASFMMHSVTRKERYMDVDENVTVRCTGQLIRSLQLTGFVANLLTLCVVSKNHLMGIVYPLKYSDYIHRWSAKRIMAAIWALSLLIGFADVPVATGMHLHNVYHAGSHMDTSCETNFSLPDALNGSSLMQDFSPDVPLTDINVDEERFVRLFEFMDKLIGVPSFERNANKTIVTTTMRPLRATASKLPLLKKGVLTGKVISPVTMQKPRQPRQLLKRNAGGKPSAVEQNLCEILTKVSATPEESTNWCVIYVAIDSYLEFGIVALVVACLIFLAICYGRIYNEVSNAPAIVESDRERRSLTKLAVTTCIFLGAFVICWLPFVSFEVITFFISAYGIINVSPITLLTIHDILNSILNSYPLIDSLVYGARILEIRKLLRSTCLRGFVAFCETRRSNMSSSFLLRSSNRISRVRYSQAACRQSSQPSHETQHQSCSSV